MEEVDIGAVARLVGDRSRAAMLTALLDGRALTVSELARLAGIRPPAASSHLGKLLDGGLVEVVAQGRHRYYRLSGPQVAAALESLCLVGPPLPVNSLKGSAAARALRPARLCYDHVAGELGVALADRVRSVGGVVPGPDGLALTDRGIDWFADAGVEVASIQAASRRRPVVRACLDWTERRDHLAGAAPAALAGSWLERGLLRRRARGERGLDVTEAGTGMLVRLGVEVCR